MAFEFVRSENDASPIEKEIVATNATTYKHGCLLAYGSDGTAVVATGTTKPEFVYEGKEITAKTGDILAVIPAFPEYEFETTLSAAGTSLKTGNKVTVDATGLLATATTTSGIFEILVGAGGASGAKVVGRFA